MFTIMRVGWISGMRRKSGGVGWDINSFTYNLVNVSYFVNRGCALIAVPKSKMRRYTTHYLFCRLIDYNIAIRFAVLCLKPTGICKYLVG